jgi:hypothetical protein
MTKHSRRGIPKGSPPSKRAFREEWGDEEESVRPEIDPSDEDLIGSVLAVPDRLWRIEALGREDHPGVCTDCQPEVIQATLVKGRDAATDRGNPLKRMIVSPSRINGLRKATSFQLVPLYRPLRNVRLLYHNRRMGTLEPELFDELRKRLAALFPPED